MEFSIVGVVGAGVIGAGVAQTLAECKFNVVLVDKPTVLANVKDRLRQNLKAARLMKRNVPSENSDVILERVQPSCDLRDLSRVAFVIENATEKWEVKKEIFEAIDEICPMDVIFAANTSAISITRIASVTKRAPKVLGIHFMNPVPLKPTVELIAGHHTSPETLATASLLLRRMGKEYVTVGDSPGFVTNRVLMLSINEAAFLVQERVAAPPEIDRIFRECFGHKMGPLETADLIGLDTILFSIEVIRESFGDDKYRPCPLLKRMVDAGLYGRKSGNGFYNYTAK